MRKASPADTPSLVELMAEFYAEAGFLLNRPHATAAFTALLADDRLGQVWLLETARGEPAGYLVLTWCYSMEYGGLKAVLDDFFVRPAYRNAGLGTAALTEARAFCEGQKIRAVTVEVDSANDPAWMVYRRIGFVPTPDRQLLTLALAPPTHSS